MCHGSVLTAFNWKVRIYVVMKDERLNDSLVQKLPIIFIRLNFFWKTFSPIAIGYIVVITS